MYASVCVSVRVGVCRRNAGQMPGANLCCCGAKACFLFTPLVVCISACMCTVCEMQVQPVADKHHHVEWYASWMLVVWQQHIIISLEARTEWPLHPPPPLPAAVCSALIYMLKSSVAWSLCLGDESEIKTTPCKCRLRLPQPNLFL